MSAPQDLGSFVKENKDILWDYWETQLEIYRLKGVKAFSKSVGYLLWVIISIFMIWLITVFIGLVMGFWLSALTGSYVMGFGITTLIFIVITLLLWVFRKPLFVNPLIKSILQKTQDLDS